MLPVVLWSTLDHCSLPNGHQLRWLEEVASDDWAIADVARPIVRTDAAKSFLYIE
jgi:hypothetical protein